jgi:hypothetical protein
LTAEKVIGLSKKFAGGHSAVAFAGAGSGRREGGDLLLERLEIGGRRIRRRSGLRRGWGGDRQLG